VTVCVRSLSARIGIYEIIRGRFSSGLIEPFLFCLFVRSSPDITTSRSLAAKRSQRCFSQRARRRLSDGKTYQKQSSLERCARCHVASYNERGVRRRGAGTVFTNMFTLSVVFSTWCWRLSPVPSHWCACRPIIQHPDESLRANPENGKDPCVPRSVTPCPSVTRSISRVGRHPGNFRFARTAGKLMGASPSGATGRD